jgi:hypothetical protein
VPDRPNVAFPGFEASFMDVPCIWSAIFAGALVVAAPAYATDTGVLPGAAIGGPGGISSPSDDGSKPSEEPAHGEDQAPGEVDWLTAPLDPERHSVWIPAAEWGAALALTIPLFLIDPEFVNTGTFSSDNFANAWTEAPVWDTDGVVSNYVLHPVMGSEAYLSLRNRDYGPFESFLFATGVSFAWEYLFEAWVEQPSGQDLIVTSPAGALLGEFRFQIKLQLVQWSPSLGRDALIILVDPLEALHRYIGHLCKDDDMEETMSSSLNFGPDGARFMLTMPF